MKYKNIVWDWNGTLLDDVRISVDTINRMLEQKNLKRLTVDNYKSIFGFPVKAYYELIGFDFSRDDWEEVSINFVNTYNALAKDVELTPGIMPVLEGLKERGVRQYILSALQEDLLINMLERFHIRGYFDGVCGSNNIYADGKVARGEEMLRTFPIDPSETLMVGDTLHDAEVAEALGFDVCLYSGGHNSAERLREKGMVLEQMGQLLVAL
ncbi:MULTISPECIES: HAD family hydrolase [Odoribacteraceae]|uniref:HAD family hydrolase n=1 Tax=Odoribacteraceae TaxID=1853231 RepID=UPI000E51E4D7|nr:MULTISPECIES: HAD family hydrolase [Odoribacteraceae]MCQ4875598.1 HAD family hydrolase [Butyricimonas paravirosa]RHR74705.1 HAD family hydrolase [Odoribacter sp. AF15-53]